MQEMKPAFALDFRDETIRLLHRTGGGWQLVGQVAITAPDLTEALGYLRATALGLSPRGIATKLILPNDQILFTTVDTGSTDVTTRTARIEAGLEGRTPYAIEDLVYDAEGIGPQIQVAVIARETLAEAEAFAAEHRFNPVSFVAVPEDGDFDGEPWFGTTAMADAILADGEYVERDAEPVTVLQRSFVPEPVAVVEEPPAEVPPAEIPLPEPEPVPAEPLPEAVPEVAPQPEPELPAQPEIAPSAPEMPVPPPAEVPDLPAPDLPSDPLPELPETAPMELPSESDLPEPRFLDPDFSIAPEFSTPVAPDDLPSGKTMFQRLSDTLATPIRQPERIAVPLEEVAEAPMALDVPQDPEPEAAPEPTPPAEPPRARVTDPGKPAMRVTDPGLDDDLPPAPAPSVVAAFSSRRQGDAVPKPVPAPAATRPAVGKPAVQKPGVAKPNARGLSAPVTAPGIAGGKPRGKVGIPSALPPLPASNPNAAATVTANASAEAARSKAATRAAPGFGAKSAPVRGKPRYLGLILTAILLFLLVMIAAWSSYSLAFWQSDEPTTVETVSADPAPPEGDATVPDAADEMAADMQDPDSLADEGSGDAVDAAPGDLAADQPDAAADPAPASLDIASSNAAPDASPAADTAATAPVAGLDVAAGAGSDAQTTPQGDGQSETLLATADAPPMAPDPLALPGVAAQGDSLPAAQAVPPPFGTVYQYDANGVIQPTPEGIITPEGVLLIAGKPPKVPAERPATLAAAALAAETAAAAMATTASPAADASAVAAEAAPPLPVDPALVGKTPKPRPAGLAPAPVDPAAAPADQGALAPAQDSRFANLRPKERPAAVLAAGEAARAASANASLAAQASDAAISPLAVSISRRPAPRPDGISQDTALAIASVAAIPEPEPASAPAAKPVAVAAAAPAPEPEPAPTAKAPEADDEPEMTSPAPKIPTKAAVAKQATYKNAINLSNLNLIGIYGTSNNRYAMVRMGNGTYKKVKVGDRIDGGKVAAITASEVRYQKGGRLITLAMPKS